MRKLLFIPFILGIMFCFCSCNIGDGRNYATLGPSPEVIINYDFEANGYKIGTPDGYFVAPSLTNYYPGDCLYMAFAIDYDNQPSTKYTVASEIQKVDIDYSYLEQNANFEVGEYTLPLSDILYSQSPFYHGKFFISSIANDNGPKFRLAYNPDEEVINGVRNLYLLAQKASPSSNSIQSIHAFDLNDLIYNYSRDTTIYEQGLKYIYVNLKYLSGISEEEKPIFGEVNRTNEPIFISVFK